MKKKLILFFVASVVLFYGCNYSKENAVMCIQLDPLQKVFKEELYFVETSDTAAVVTGETATFQFVIRSNYSIRELKVEAGDLVNGNWKIVATEKAFVGYIRAGNHARIRSIDAILPISDLYPDCLLEVESMDVSSLSNQPIWVGYTVPRDAIDGNYSATLVFSGKINGKTFRITRQVNAKIYPVTLPEQTLWVTNWFSDAGFSEMNGNQPVEPYTDRYWELLTALANMMRDHGQNSYIFWDWPGLCKIECVDSQYSFDFTNFDRMVELLIHEGDLKLIEGGHLGSRMGDWDSDFGISVPKLGIRPIDDDATQNFLSQFLPALYHHLEIKGWTKMYVQHIADEPIDGNASSYIKIVEYVKKRLPGIKIIEAVESSKLANTVNVWVPKLNHYHDNYSYFQERQKSGDEVWFYTCCDPQGNYANRFLELPLVQTRFLHWINYRYGATGYLHWGFNWWNSNTTNDATSDGQTWPGGDSWIVYPADGKVYSSIRLAAMRDGIADYELLKLLEQKAPDKAKELVGAVIKDFDSYNSNIRAFRLVRLKLLKSLIE